MAETSRRGFDSPILPQIKRKDYRMTIKETTRGFLIEGVADTYEGAAVSFMENLGAAIELFEDDYDIKINSPLTIIVPSDTNEKKYELKFKMSVKG